MSPNAKVKMQNEKKTSSLSRQVKEYVQEKFQTRHVEVERTKSDDSIKDDKKGPKFGIRVLPPSVNEKLFGKSPSKMQADNENNTNIEKKNEEDKQKQQVEVMEFERQNSINSSGIRKDANGMPVAMPETMMQAAMAAKEHRKSGHVMFSDTKKSKGMAPIPPQEDELDMTTASTDTIIDMDMTDHAKMIVEEAIQSATEHISKTMSEKMMFDNDFSDISQVDGERMKPTSNSSTPRSDKKKLSSDTESQMAHGEYCP